MINKEMEEEKDLAKRSETQALNISEDRTME